MNVSLVCSTDPTLFRDMLHEYDLHGEICHPYEFNLNADTTTYLSYIHDGEKLIGVLRYTPELRNPCHGNIGISIRPSERGKGYGRAAIRMELQTHKILDRYVTACIAEDNQRSIAAFTSCGMRETGKTYEWRKDGKVTIAKEFAYGHLHQSD